MVTIEMVKRSLPSRPRKAVVFWAFVAFVIGAAGFAFWLALKFVPTLLPNLADTKWTMMQTEYDLRSFLVDWAMPMGMLVFFFVAWVLAQVITNYRLFYLLFALPSTIVAIALVLAGIVLIITPVHSYIPNSTTILKWVRLGYTYGAMGYAGLLLLFSFIALFYNHTYPPKYGRIYHLKKARIRLSKSGSERRRVKKDFYKFYKKGKCKELIGLLVEPYLEKESTLELIPEAIYYMKLNGGDANGEIKGYEIDAALKQHGDAGARDVYQQTLVDLESARNGDLSFLERGTAEPQIIIKKVPVPVAKPTKPKVDTRPIDDPLWAPDEIK